MPVRFLARLTESDNRTVLGRSLSTLHADCGTNDENFMVSPAIVKSKMTYKALPEEEAWRPKLGKELLLIRE